MGHQIFVVEDHAVMRAAYAAVLQAEPDLDLCSAVASANEAVTALDGLACSLVVTDLRLPGLTGLDLVRLLHAARPDLPVLVITAHEDDAFAREAKAAGAAALLRKRGLTETLVSTIREVLGAPLPLPASP